MLLMIRINHDHRRIMAKRRVPCLDDYLDRVYMLLWPRFKVGCVCEGASCKVACGWVGGFGGGGCMVLCGR